MHKTEFFLMHVLYKPEDELPVYYIGILMLHVCVLYHDNPLPNHA